MGLIENGAADAVVPSKTLFAVNYPGYPTSMERAIQTLGGEDGIAKARLSNSNYLELRFRQEDPFAHPIFGEPSTMSGLLLKLTKVHGHENNTRVNAEIVGKVSQSYDFSGMADYQYIAPVHGKLARGKKRRYLQHFQREQEGVLEMEQEEIMILPPPLFSLKDIPEELILRPSEAAKASHRQRLLAEQPWEMEIMPCFHLDFKIKEIPSKTNWKQKLHKGSEEWAVQCAIDKLFEEKPIWTKSSINERLLKQKICLTDLQLRRCFFRMSYYFAHGPFRLFWIKNGYDPRKDPESRIWQMVDFRIPQSIRDDVDACISDKVTWNDICTFKQAPLKKFSYLQLCELEDDYIQSTIRLPPERSMCSESTGWFSRATISRLRHQVRVRYLSLIPGDSVRNLEQRELKKLESLKQDELIANAQRLMTAEKVNDSILESTTFSEMANTSLQVGELLSWNPYPEQEQDEEDEEEGDEEENEDEEFDEQIDVLDAGAPKFYMDPFDSVPKTYLQELLEKFPMSTGENIGTRHIDLSDEELEYAIYEQEEDEEDD